MVFLLLLLRGSMLLLLPLSHRRPDSAPFPSHLVFFPANLHFTPDALHVSLGDRSFSMDLLVLLFVTVGVFVHWSPLSGEDVFCGV